MTRFSAPRCLPSLSRIALAWSIILVTVGTAACASPPAASRLEQVERVQLHRNGNRGWDYLPLARADGSTEPATFAFRPLSMLPVPGDPIENVRANVHPIDVDGDGDYELLQANGSRFMRVMGRDGRRLWEARNPVGRVHRSQVHRDTLAIFDVDGDRRQEILHCWVFPGTRVKHLVVRRGDTGAVVRTVALTGDPDWSECQIAAYRVAHRTLPLLLVSRQLDLPDADCPRLFVDTWAVTAAFDPATLNRRWQRSTCDAGHYPRAVDEDNDGTAEAILVGKYLIGPEGWLRCILPGWGTDHPDTMVVADFVPTQPGHEAVTGGQSGLRLYRAASCALLPLKPIPDFANPQHLSAVRFASDDNAPSIIVRQRNTDTAKIKPVLRLDGAGMVLHRYLDDNSDPQSTGRMPMTNGNLDGAAAAEDLVAWFGQVLDPQGRVRLGTGWYWDLQRLGPDEQDLSAYDQWTNAPVVFDLDGNGRDELITWGRQNIVIGTAAAPPG